MDTLAFESTHPRPDVLWARFAPPLRSFLRKRAPREADVDDLVQEVFVRVQARLHALREVDRVDAWIFQIARAVVVDTFRDRARHLALEAASDLEAGASPPEGDERAGELALASCLSSLMEHLAAPYREAIELTEIRGLTQAEAATLVGISHSGMKSRVQRGRLHLEAVIRTMCRIERDVRGTVTDCAPVRLSGPSFDSMSMSDANESKPTETKSDARPAAEGCCGGPAKNDPGACCVLDAESRATGGSGCGCRAKTATPEAKGCC